MQFSENLRVALTNSKLTQQKLAEQLGTTQQTVSRWLKGINEPDFETLIRICIILNETPNTLLGFNE